MDKLKKKCQTMLLDITALINQLAAYKDEQFVLDFCDKLNELSVKY